MSDEAFVNASPLILLSRVGQLELLRLAGRTIFVPAAVRAEIDAKGPADPISRALEANPWLQAWPTGIVPAEILSQNLGAGEAAVLAAARAKSATAVLDDLQARQWAATAGVACVGTVGLVLRAKNRGVLQKIRPVIDSLLANGMHLSATVTREVLQRAGE